MGSAFDDYYYDNPLGRDIEENSKKTKLEIAASSINGLLNHLTAEDRFGMILYNNQAYIGKRLNLVGDTNMDRIKQHILEIKENGGTNFDAGYSEGTALFDETIDIEQPEYENRIIFLTDAMPNRGDTTEQGLFGLIKANADKNIYTTFIGIGVDFNTELIESLTKIRGANYYSVHSPQEFSQRMDAEFNYMVTPLVFNLNLNLESQGYKIEKVYGSPEANEASGEIMKINTLFPSKTQNNETKGGIVVIKLKKISSDASLKLKVFYEDRSGKIDTSEAIVSFNNVVADFYENTGIRKAILLARYADLMKDWINDERLSYANNTKIIPVINKTNGIQVPGEPEVIELGKWERQSTTLKVSAEYKILMKEFQKYFTKEVTIIGDNALSQESDLLTLLGK